MLQNYINCFIDGYWWVKICKIMWNLLFLWFSSPFLSLQNKWSCIFYLVLVFAECQQNNIRKIFWYSIEQHIYCRTDNSHGKGFFWFVHFIIVSCKQHGCIELNEYSLKISLVLKFVFFPAFANSFSESCWWIYLLGLFLLLQLCLIVLLVFFSCIISYKCKSKMR